MKAPPKVIQCAVSSPFCKDHINDLQHNKSAISAAVRGQERASRLKNYHFSSLFPDSTAPRLEYGRPLKLALIALYHGNYHSISLIYYMQMAFFYYSSVSTLFLLIALEFIRA
jgi:hypothetical protein